MKISNLLDIFSLQVSPAFIDRHWKVYMCPPFNLLRILIVFRWLVIPTRP